MEDRSIENQKSDLDIKGEGCKLLTGTCRSRLAVFTAVIILMQVATLAAIQLVGIHRLHRNMLGEVTGHVGWSAYSSGIGVGLALLIVTIALYARITGTGISRWPGFAAGLSKLCASMLILTPLLGQVNTYTAMCSGLGAGVQNASIVGTKISEALVSTICGYAAFSMLLVAYTFTFGTGERKDECA